MKHYTLAHKKEENIDVNCFTSPHIPPTVYDYHIINLLTDNQKSNINNVEHGKEMGRDIMNEY